MGSAGLHSYPMGATHPGRPPSRDQVASSVVQAVQVVLEGGLGSSGWDPKGGPGVPGRQRVKAGPTDPDVSGGAIFRGGTNGGMVSGDASDFRTVSIC